MVVALVLAGALVHWVFETSTPLSELDPRDRWVSYQSLQPEVRAWLAAEHKYAWIRSAKLRMHYLRPTPQVCTVCVLSLTLEEEPRLDFQASYSALAEFPEPWKVELEDLLAASYVYSLERELRHLLREGGLSPQRFRELRARFQDFDREREEERLRRELGFERPPLCVQEATYILNGYGY